MGTAELVLAVAAIIVSIGVAALAFARSIGGMSAKLDGYGTAMTAHAKASSERSDKLEAQLADVRESVGQIGERVAKIEGAMSRPRLAGKVS